MMSSDSNFKKNRHSLCQQFKKWIINHVCIVICCLHGCGKNHYCIKKFTHKFLNMFFHGKQIHYIKVLKSNKILSLLKWVEYYCDLKNHLSKLTTKELSLCHTLRFSYVHIFAAWWCKPLIFQNWIIKSNKIHSLKYLRAMTLGCKDMGIRKFKLNSFNFLSCFFLSTVSFSLFECNSAVFISGATTLENNYFYQFKNFIHIFFYKQHSFWQVIN